jgi:hypothetical protein
MPINIKNREAERLLDSLAKQTRMGKSRLVLELLRKEAARQLRVGTAASRKKRIQAISRRSARRLGRSPKTPEQIIGYGDDGLPT